MKRKSAYFLFKTTMYKTKKKNYNPQELFKEPHGNNPLKNCPGNLKQKSLYLLEPIKNNIT
ncbi:hypothetical protein BSG1_16395 [Bacillus sp. SG-1]|nr:hypothetical protein BSG1_16395 [Bacillus sp. SG-1]